MGERDNEPPSEEGAARRPGTRAPHRSRERALKILFQADVRGQQPLDVLREVVDDPAAAALLDDLDDPDADAGAPAGRPEPLDRYARALVQGVHDHADRIDGLIERFAERWSVSRMPAVDRNILRLATYELLFEQVPAAVVIDEAVELARELGATDRSVAFVNGVLAAIDRQAPTADPPATTVDPEVPDPDERG